MSTPFGSRLTCLSSPSWSHVNMTWRFCPSQCVKTGVEQGPIAGYLVESQVRFVGLYLAECNVYRNALFKWTPPIFLSVTEFWSVGKNLRIGSLDWSLSRSSYMQEEPLWNSSKRSEVSRYNFHIQSSCVMQDTCWACIWHLTSVCAVVVI